MRKNAGPVDSLDMLADQQIKEPVFGVSEAASPSADTSAGDMSPMEAAILAISQDAATMLRVALQIQEQGKTLETAARALAAGMAEVNRACGSRTSSKN
jgi:hypothetical protein